MSGPACPRCGAPISAQAFVAARCPSCGIALALAAAAPPPAIPPPVPRRAPPPAPPRAQRFDLADARFTATNVGGGGTLAQTSVPGFGDVAKQLALQPDGAAKQAYSAEQPRADLPRPAELARPETIGAGAVLLVASLLQRFGGGADAVRASADLLDRALATCKDPRDTARLVLAKGALAGASGSPLPEAELEGIDPSMLRSLQDRASLASLLRSIAARRRGASDRAGANRAALAALRASNSAEVAAAAVDDGERLALLLATGDVTAASQLAIDRWAANLEDPEALQIAASTLLRLAVRGEDQKLPFDERQKSWEAAVGVVAIVCSWPSFWERLARKRADVYKKEIDAEQRELAQRAARERVVKLLREIEERHRDAGRVEDRALVARMAEALQIECNHGLRLERLAAEHPGAGLPTLPFPCGPLGLDVLDLREDTFQAVHKLAEGSGDAAVHELLGALGELAEGWSLLSDGRIEDAAAFARAKLRVQPRSREASRLLASAARKRILECLDKKEVAAAEGVVSWFAAEVPTEIHREVELVCWRLLEAGDAARARGLVQSIRARGDSDVWKTLEATVLHRTAVRVANDKNDFQRAIELLLDARRIDPSNAEINNGLRISGGNLIVSIIEQRGHDEAIVRFEQLGAEGIPPLAAALARGLNLRAVKKADSNNLWGAQADLDRALKLVDEDAELRSTIRTNLAQVHVGLAVNAAKGGGMYARTSVITHLKSAADLGSVEARKHLREMGVPGYGAFDPFANMFNRRP